jgi:pimeloyl-ACP methyl ester carboxylesterase
VTQPRQDSVLCLSASGFHRMAYREWGGEAADRTVVCVHGLTGTARDFDELAGVLAGEGYRVICPDVVGRGASDWLADPESYALRQYVADMATLVGRLRVSAVDWVGTSMGGLIGMALAGHPRTPVRSLVVNDIGPFVPTAALRRLEAYLGTDPAFADLDAAERWLREVRAPFGPLSDEQWRRMTERTVRQVDGSGYRLHYDPRIAVPFGRTAGRDVDIWDVWDRITCPVLVIRGAESDLLLAATAAEMTKRGPKAEVVEVPGCGHAPGLMDAAQIACMTDWLRGSPA